MPNSRAAASRQARRLGQRRLLAARLERAHPLPSPLFHNRRKRDHRAGRADASVAAVFARSAAPHTRHVGLGFQARAALAFCAAFAARACARRGRTRPAPRRVVISAQAAAPRALSAETMSRNESAALARSHISEAILRVLLRAGDIRGCAAFWPRESANEALASALMPFAEFQDLGWAAATSTLVALTVAVRLRIVERISAMNFRRLHVPARKKISAFMAVAACSISETMRLRKRTAHDGPGLRVLQRPGLPAAPRRRFSRA